MSSSLLAPSAVGVGGVSAAETTVVPGNLLVCGNIIGGGGVTQLVAGTNVTLSPPSGEGVVTVNATGGAGGVTSVTASGAGITASPTSGAVVVANTGVTSLVAGSGVSVSGPAGAVTVANTGVTSLVAGSGISLSGATGAVTVTAALPSYSFQTFTIVPEIDNIFNVTASCGIIFIPPGNSTPAPFIPARTFGSGSGFVLNAFVTLNNPSWNEKTLVMCNFGTAAEYYAGGNDYRQQSVICSTNDSMSSPGITQRRLIIRGAGDPPNAPLANGYSVQFFVVQGV